MCLFYLLSFGFNSKKNKVVLYTELSYFSGDKNFTNHFENILSKLNLEAIANTTQFEPTITGIIKDNFYEINTIYYLGFSHKKEVLRPLIELYKALIDYKQLSLEA